MMRNTRATLAEYRIWATMRNRCTSPQSAGFKDYGARGIRVCERWHTFGNFLADMGRRPSQRHALKRLDTRGHCCPVD